MSGIFFLRRKQLLLMISVLFAFSALGQPVQLKISKHYLNIPLGDKAKMYAVDVVVKGEKKRELPVQIATDTISYWIYLDVSEFKGQTITLTSLAPPFLHSAVFTRTIK